MARRMKGEGSLYQTKEKTWVCQYYDTDGNRRTKRFQRKADGRAFLDGLKERYVMPQNAGRRTSAEYSPSGPTVRWPADTLTKVRRPSFARTARCLAL